MGIGDLYDRLTPRSLRDAIEKKIQAYLHEEARKAIREEVQKSSLVDVHRAIQQEVERIQYADQLDGMLRTAPWAIDRIEFSEDHIEMYGWALPPLSDHALAHFTVNGSAFEEVYYPLIRPDVGEMLWFRHRAAESGFICKTPFSKVGLEPDQPLTLSFLRKDTMQPVRETHDYYFYDYARDLLTLPGPDRRRRSHGNDSEGSFRIEGYTTFVKLRRALNRCFGKDFADFSSILDWGCGCGRVTRYFAGVGGVSVTGVDIDVDNLGWCERNLRFARFAPLSLHPPTDLKSDSFDLLIGISVFTHLREEEQFEWLSELRRIARPEAVLLMTVLGDDGVCRGGLDYAQFREWTERGISAVKKNPDLDGFVSDAEYYRNTFHTYRYIKEKWSQYFHVTDVVRGYIGNQQDLIVMTKPQD